MRAPSSPVLRTRPCPSFGRPVHLGFPHRLRPGTSPHALRLPPHGGHPALRSTASSGYRSALAVSSFRLRPFRRLHTFCFLRPARNYPRFWIWRPSFERQRDFNPPEQRAAQRAVPNFPITQDKSGRLNFRFSTWRSLNRTPHPESPIPLLRLRKENSAHRPSAQTSV